MTATLTYTLGKFVWRELFSPDPAAAKAFYGAVFGWTANDVPMPGMSEPYRLWHNGEHQIGGLMNPKACDMDHVPPHWAIYVSVADVDAAAGRVEGAGGKVLMGPADIPNVGRFATIQDPKGGVLNLYKSNGGDEEDKPAATHEFCWETLCCSEPGAVIPFYKAVVGWDQEGEGPMLLFTRDGGKSQVANIAAVPAEIPTYWGTYVSVTDLDATNEKIKAAGGTVVEPRIDVPGVGSLALVQDPQGVMFSTFQPA